MIVFHCPSCNTELDVRVFDKPGSKEESSISQIDLASGHTLKGFRVSFTRNEVLEFYRSHDLVWTPRKFYIVIDEKAVGILKLVVRMLEDKYPEGTKWKLITANDAKRVLERLGFTICNWY